MTALKNLSDSTAMASFITAKIFNFISRYFPLGEFLSSFRPLPADRNRTLNFKSFQGSFVKQSLVSRRADLPEELNYEPSRVVEPYDKV